MSDSIFTKIIKGEIPSHKVYEDDHTFAFMDIAPIQPGQVVVVTKTPAETFLDLEDNDAAALWRAVRVVGRKLREAYPQKKRIAVLFEGLEVNHVHAKLFPFDTHEQYVAAPATEEPDHQELARIAEKLRSIK